MELSSVTEVTVTPAAPPTLSIQIRGNQGCLLLGRDFSVILFLKGCSIQILKFQDIPLPFTSRYWRYFSNPFIAHTALCCAGAFPGLAGKVLLLLNLGKAVYKLRSAPCSGGKRAEEGLEMQWVPCSPGVNP